MKADKWYSIVSISPNPEILERFPFGIAVCDGERIKLEVGRNIGDSYKFLPKEQRVAFDLIASSLAKDLSDPAKFDATVRSFGPQIVFGERIGLNAPVTKGLVRYLIQSWFSTQSSHPKAAAPLGHAVKSRHVIEDALRTLAPGFGAKLTSKASPTNLGYTIQGNGFRSEHAQLDYAVSGSSRDLLIAAVDLKMYELEKEPQEKIISAKTIKASKALWLWKTNRPELERISRKQFKTIGLVLNGVHSTELRDWERFIEHIWGPDCDGVLKVHDEQLQDVLSKEVSWAIA